MHFLDTILSLQSSAKPVTASVPSTSKGRAVTMRMTGKTGESSRHWGRSLSPTLDPPMASVVVERHQPVTKVGIWWSYSAFLEIHLVSNDIH